MYQNIEQTFLFDPKHFTLRTTGVPKDYQVFQAAMPLLQSGAFMILMETLVVELDTVKKSISKDLL